MKKLAIICAAIAAVLFVGCAQSPVTNNEWRWNHQSPTAIVRRVCAHAQEFGSTNRTCVDYANEQAVALRAKGFEVDFAYFSTSNPEVNHAMVVADNYAIENDGEYAIHLDGSDPKVGGTDLTFLGIGHRDVALPFVPTNLTKK